MLAAGARLTLTAVTKGTATIRVIASDPGGLTASQTFTVVVGAARPFTDEVIRPGVTPVRAVHFTELRTRIDGLRTAAGLGGFAWTDTVLMAGVTRVRLVRLLELRSAPRRGVRGGGGTAGSAVDRRSAGGRDDADPGRAPDGVARRGAGAGVTRTRRRGGVWGDRHQQVSSNRSGCTC